MSSGRFPSVWGQETGFGLRTKQGRGRVPLQVAEGHIALGNIPLRAHLPPQAQRFQVGHETNYEGDSTGCGIPALASSQVGSKSGGAKGKVSRAELHIVSRHAPIWGPPGMVSGEVPAVLPVKVGGRVLPKLF